ncbi:MAG: hypothetical protein U1B78_02130, partial [Dehalococcoidia bacterium]|nr:hypothetical protein [Dehalococcoidia bacterium]
ARLSWREPFVHLLALPAGAAASLGMILSAVSGSSPVARYEALEARMGDWFHAAATGGISDDGLPVIVLVVPLAWLAAYASSWAAFRWRNAWLALVPGGGALLANISLLPGQFSFAFVVFLLGGTLLVTRMHLVERERTWRDDGTPYPWFLSLSVLHASFWVALLLLLCGWLLPQANEADALESVWRRATAPVTDRVTPLSRLFISVNAKKGGPIHDFEDILPFLGSIDLTSKEVLEVIAPGLDQPRYLRAQAYHIYTPDGWKQGRSQTTVDNQIIDHDEALSFRDDIAIEVISKGETGDTIFAFGQPRAFDRDVRYEGWSVPGNVAGVEAEETLQRGERYEAIGSVSVATEDDLRSAWTDYPDWVASQHLQLPRDFPKSVSGLALELTASEPTPYDKAVAIESYLRAIPYDLDVP